jgi:hypothetical protein
MNIYNSKYMYYCSIDLYGRFPYFCIFDMDGNTCLYMAEMADIH